MSMRKEGRDARNNKKLRTRRRRSSDAEEIRINQTPADAEEKQRPKGIVTVDQIEFRQESDLGISLQRNQ